MCINYLLSVASFKILNDVIICTLLDSRNKILIEKVYVLIHMYNSQCNWTYDPKFQLNIYIYIYILHIFSTFFFRNFFFFKKHTYLLCRMIVV